MAALTRGGHHPHLPFCILIGFDVLVNSIAHPLLIARLARTETPVTEDEGVEPTTTQEGDSNPPCVEKKQFGRPRRILFLDHTGLLGGGEIALLNLVRHLDPVRYQPVVGLFSEGPLADSLRKAGIETHIIELTNAVLHTRKDTLSRKALLRWKDGFTILVFAWKLAGWMKQLDVSLVHTNSLKADVIGGLAGRLAGLRVLWHVRDRIDEDYLPRPAVRGFRWLCRHIPHFIIANSNSTLKTIDLPTVDRSATVHSGIDLSQRSYVVHDGLRADSQNGLTADLRDSSRRLPGSRLRIGLVGRISRWKGQHVFLRAAAQVVARFPTAEFQIIGAPLFSEESYEQELRDLVVTLGLEKQVNFLGFRSDIAQVVGDLDILVHASITGEPFGQVIIEGMAAGKPVVATRGGGVPEIVIDRLTGLLVPMGDVEAMAEAICSVASDPEMAAQMGQYGRQRVIEHFTIETTARNVMLLYDRILLDQSTSALSKTASSWRASGKDTLARVAVVAGSFSAALLVSLFLHQIVPERNPVLLTFLAPVILGAWLAGSFWAILTAILAIPLIVRFQLLAGVADPLSQARFYIFLGISAFIAIVLGRLRAANQRIQKSLSEAELAARKAALLAEASTMFFASLDEAAVLESLAGIGLREMADWCSIDIMDSQGALIPTLQRHRESKVHPDYPHAFLGATIERVLRSGRAQILSTVSFAEGGISLPPPKKEKKSTHSAETSFMVLPLIAANEILGTIIFAAPSTKPAYDTDDLRIASELVLRAALAIHNVRRFSDMRRKADQPDGERRELSPGRQQ